MKLTCNVETENVFLYNYYWCMCTQQRQQQTKLRHLIMNVAVDWYTNLHAVNNGGQVSIKEYQPSFTINSQYIKGRLELSSVSF